ncbi:polyprenyl synthetase family protein [Nocardioides furvisabuli]|uniref:polyprenyl synthetase family protein n=1 Tax=Nocardioides furvisabuli TaxID=375542 RepID=UPI0035572874
MWKALPHATEGGKRFRPALLRATHDALGGELNAAALQIGAALEIMHTAFVIHDDVIDGDLIRRGRLNVSGNLPSPRHRRRRRRGRRHGLRQHGSHSRGRPCPHNCHARGGHLRGTGPRWSIVSLEGSGLPFQGP